MNSKLTGALCLLACAALFHAAGHAPGGSSAQTPPRRVLTDRDLGNVVLPQATPELPSRPAEGQEEQQPAGAPAGRCVFAKPVDVSLFETSEATGGQMYMLDPAEAWKGLDLAGLEAKGYRETIFRAAGDLSDGAREFVVSVDSSVERVAFVAFVECKEWIRIVTPFEREAGEGPYTSDEHLRAGRVLLVEGPGVGAWRVSLKGSGKFTLAVKAQSGISLGQFRLGPGGDFPSEGDSKMPKVHPPPEEERGFRAKVYGGHRVVQVRLLAVDGTQTGSQVRWLTKRGDGWEEVTCFLGLPAVPFRIAVEGRDALGQEFIRVNPRVFSPRMKE
jgi:hypothetical protein